MTALQYRRPSTAALPAGIARLAALTLVVALVLDAPASRARVPEPIVALDVSASWRRAGDTAAFARALARAREIAAGAPIMAIGDSARPFTVGTAANDVRSSIGAVATQALAAGRPLIIVTHGELEDTDRLSGLPGGSRTELITRVERPDLAALRVEAPLAVVAGDTIDATVTVMAGAAGSPRTALSLLLDGAAVGRQTIDALPAGGESRARFRLVARGRGTRVLTAALGAVDAERRNDSLSVAMEIAAVPAVVWVSSAPDQDSRFALAALRGTLRLPVRAYVRIAPTEWRVEGPLTPVSVDEIRRAVRDAGIVVLHGDTTMFGAPRALVRGRLALFPTPPPGNDDWYPVAVPASPLTASLSGVALDSLPPIDVGAAAPTGDWEGLTVARARRLDRRTVIAGTDRPRRVVVIDAGGLWRWKFRGGASEAAFVALWGAVFDWLAEERRDTRALSIASPVVRAGEPIAWRGVPDSGATIIIRGADGSVADSARLDRESGTSSSRALGAGRYVADVPGGRIALVVNESREWLPGALSARSEAASSASPPLRGEPLRGKLWPYAAAIALLCMEWLLRRRSGLR